MNLTDPLTLMLGGAALMLLGWLSIVARAFQQSLGWGLTVFLLPYGAFAFFARDLKGSLAGFLMINGGGLLMVPFVVQQYQIQQQEQGLSMVVNLESASESDIEASARSAAAEERWDELQRQAMVQEYLLNQRTKMNEGAQTALRVWYQKLEHRRALYALLPKAQQEDFSREVAAYQALTQRYETEKAAIQKEWDNLAFGHHHL
ncbi:MAG: hypothetical protein ACFCU3_10430 [Verrucomicrobiales bacterium]